MKPLPVLMSLSSSGLVDVQPAKVDPVISAWRLEDGRDWRTSPDLYGFRLPLTTKMKDYVISNVKEPLCAIPQKEDDAFKKLHFKYVMP